MLMFTGGAATPSRKAKVKALVVVVAKRAISTAVVA
jgi:hypothetical protein